ncbi:peptide chain release factor N(5)-glutamine methyltransferase [Bdellovibrio svalbardensis]|uniref:Release factor glutamine methyltransferase n=1 Tax=Bdellovibrio svalbardensis TaxID=2972972 RepID=A0ABT6DDD6_9BACT|nr:peptide chain release factor N(5)-glutamine methyltransferase [Bdellovibrio svalbardensis]MDG0814856.1 peptide chain release factor N(5)-glutamine methyltransferase [Bdellovibrio svalbardensis]
MKLKEVLDITIAFFKDKKIETPRLDAELLFAHYLKLERIQLYMKFDQPLQETELAGLRELVRRRVQGEPVAYILGYRDFYGYRFEVNSATLIPRPETEHIVEEVVKWTADKEKPWTMIDLGCGSGCIGLSLLKQLPQARLIAVDLSDKALEVAQRNAQTLEVADRVQFVHSDAGNVDLVMSSFKDFMGQDTVDVLLSNPPYIAANDPSVEENVKKYEPSSALYADEEGLALLKKWSKDYAPYLSSEAVMLMEMGMSQGMAMKSHFENLKIFKSVRVVKDLSGHDRVIYGVKHG